MGMKRTCVLCNTEYEYCPKCRGYNSNEKWRNIFCSEDCREINTIRDKYKTNTIDAKTAKLMMSKYKIPDISKMADWSRPTMEEIFNASTVSTLTSLNIEDLLEPTINIEESKEEIVEEIKEEVVEEKIEEKESDEISTSNSFQNFKKRKKKNTESTIVNDDFNLE